MLIFLMKTLPLMYVVLLPGGITTRGIDIKYKSFNRPPWRCPLVPPLLGASVDKQV